LRYSFSIGQKYDDNVLETIRSYFMAKSKVNKRTSGIIEDFFYFETYSHESVSRVIAHCCKYPLLGEKSVQLQTFLIKFPPALKPRKQK